MGVDAGSGEVTAVRHDRWRLFDWFWMLHIMDYDERSDFSTPLLTGGRVYGGMDPDTLLTYGFDRTTGAAAPGTLMLLACNRANTSC